MPRSTAGKTAYKYAHKLFEPRVRQGAVPREFLLARMFGADPARVVLIQGPAGHGKSTLLQQAMAECRARGMIAGWLTADEADNDLRRLSMHLQALLTAMAEEHAPGASGRAELDEQGSRADGFIARLLDFGRPVALFLDDFQALGNRSVLAFFRDLLDHLPDNVRVFIGSRAIPDIGLARQVVNNQALILRAEDLRFSPIEVRRFFAGAQDLAMREDELDAIYRKTEGWPAALQLFRLSLTSPGVRRSLSDIGAYRPRELADYLADNVLDLQSPEVQEFLRQTGPLLRLCGALCDEVLGRDDSQVMLQRVERAGLFVRELDSERRWFSYHALFSAFLDEQLRSDAPERRVLIHRRAAAWFFRNGLHEDAIQHAVAAGDYRLAAEVLDAWSSRLVALGHLVTAERWYDSLPLDEVERRPDLVVKIAWALCFLRRYQKLKPIVALLRRLPQDHANGETLPDVVRSMLAIVLDDDLLASREIVHRVEVRGQNPTGFRAFELGAAANLCGYIAMTGGDLEGGREYLALARAYGDQAEAGFSLGYSIATFGMNLMIQGFLPEALERFREAAAQPWARLDESAASAVLVGCHVQALYEAGDIDAAESLFEQSRETIARVAMLDYVAVSFIAMSRIHDLRGRPAQALETLDQAENIGHTSLWPRLVRLVGWERVRRHLVRGEPERAQAVASRIVAPEQALPPGWIPFCEDVEDERIGQARLAIHRAGRDEALRILAEELAQAQRQGRVRRQIKLLVLEAVAHHARGSENVALRSLGRALALAAAGRFVRCFLDEGDAVVVMLKRIWESQGGAATMDPTLRHVEHLLDAAGADRGPDNALSDFQALEPLTEREKRILVLLANGVSYEEMAGRVFVSKNTIKYHLKNIYSKLAVNGRLQAINAARSMGLIR